MYYTYCSWGMQPQGVLIPWARLSKRGGIQKIRGVHFVATSCMICGSHWLDCLAVALILMVCVSLENFRLCMIQYYHMAHFLLSRNLEKKIYSHSNVLNRNLLRNIQKDQEWSMKNCGTFRVQGTKGINNIHTLLGILFLWHRTMTSCIDI